jgi:6-phosphogluconolactonase
MKPQIEIFDDNEAMARHVADRIMSQARKAIGERGRFTFVLTGGKSPLPLYRLLAEDAAYRDFPWQQTLCFFGDERDVPPDDPKSNYLLARKNLFHSGRVPDENIFRFHAELPDPDRAAAEYEEKLRSLFSKEECLDGFPRFDVVLLGLGANGHIASLFPCAEALHEKKRWAVANLVPDLDEQRLTLTYPVFNAAREIYLQSIQPLKKQIIENVLEAEEKKFRPFPVQGIGPVDGGYYWFLTRATAPSPRKGN